MLREKLINANKWCHIYTDVDGVTNIHDTENNETYRIIPDKSELGFYIEYHKDAELKARNSISFDGLKSLALLAGSNHLLNNLIGGETETDNASNEIQADYPFVEKFKDFQNEYDHFLEWCLDNNGKMTQDEWDEKKANQFKKRGLDVFFKSL